MPRRTLNLKAAALLSCVTLVLALGVHVLHGFQVKRGAKGLLALASRAESEGRRDKAREYLHRYLALRPDDVDALARLAALIEREDDSPQGRTTTLGVYRKALRLAGGRSDIRRRLLDLAIRSEDFTEALPHVELLLRESPNSGELTYRLGRCQEAAGRSSEAVASYEKARKLDPAQVEAYVRQASLLRLRFRDSDRADRIMDARRDNDGLIAHNGQSAAAFLARARYRQRYAVPGVDAAADIARALELAPDDPDVLLAAAESAREKGQFDAAHKLLEHGLEKHPNTIAFYQAMADLELKAGQTEAAVSWMRKGFALTGPDRADAQAALGWLLGDVLCATGRTKEANSVIEQLSGRAMRPELIEYLKARALVAQSRWGAGAKQFQELVPRLSSQPAFNDLTKRALVLLGQCYERLGNVDQRYDAYRRAVAIELENDPLWVEARLGLASSLVDLNRLNEALEQYRIVLPKQPAAGLTMARLQIVQNLRRPADQQRWDEIEQTLSAVERGFSGSRGEARADSNVSVLRAESLAAQGQLSPARRLLEQARDKYPDDADLWVALANLAGREGKPQDTLAVLDEAGRRLGERIELKMARAGYWTGQGGDEAVAALKEIERDADKLLKQDSARLRRELAAGYGRLGQDARAKALWTQLAAEQPDDLNIQLALFNQAIRAGDDPGAEHALEQVRRIEGDGPLEHYAKAVLLVGRARREKDNRSLLTDARSELVQAAERRPHWARILVARADVESLSGNVETAIQDYLRAILEMGERDAVVVTRLLQLLNERGRVADAAQVVQKLTDERMPLSGDLQRLVAQVSYQSGDPGRALKFAQSTVSADSQNPDELVWLAQIQWAAGQPAEPTLRRAVALAGESPKTWLALIVYLAGTGQKDEAEAALKKAAQAIPPKSAPLALAQANEVLGHRDAAAALFQKAVEAKPDDVPTLRALATFYLRSGRRADAESTLQRLIALGGTTTDAAWARRLLATVMGLGGDYRQSLKALEILGLSAGSADPAKGAAPAEDVRTKARILAVQPNRARRREAIGLLEGLVQRRESTPGDLFLLAQLDEADGDWPKARGRMLELVNSREKNPVYTAALIRALLRHDRADEAAVYLAKIEQVASGQPILIELKARVLAARGKAGEAVALLNDYAKADDNRTVAAARLLEELKQTTAAEALYRQLVAREKPERPAGTMALTQFLGRHGRTGEALDLLEGAWTKLSPEAATHACIVILFANLADDAACARVARRLEHEAQSHPDSVSIQFDLANLRLFQDRYADAEAIYRAIYERDTTASASLNNLAWLLATRGASTADQALTLIGQAIERSGETPNLLDTRAIAHMAKGQTDVAVRELEDAIAVRPTGKEYLHLARAYQLQRRPDDAASAVRKAKELGVTVADLHPLERPVYAPLLDQK